MAVQAAGLHFCNLLYKEDFENVYVNSFLTKYHKIFNAYKFKACSDKTDKCA